MGVPRKIIGIMAFTSLFACSHAEFRPRAIGGGAIADSSTGGDLAEANMQFVSGNFALAISSYRKAIREAPESAEAYTGLAMAYDRLGRGDLSRRYYEQAAALGAGGAAARAVLASAQSQEAGAQAPAQVAEGSGMITIPVLPAPPIFASEATTPSPAQAGYGAQGTPAAPPAPRSGYGAQVTIALPPAEAAPREGMRLERISAGEVALVTRPAPRVVPSRVVPSRVATAAPRALPGQPLPITMVRNSGNRIEWRLDPPAPRPAAQQATAVRILNAVGRRGQAARMERHLRSLGWRNVTVGDSTARRTASIIFCTAATSREARALARRLPFATQLTIAEGPRRVLLVLGRNSATFDTRLQAGRSRT